MAEIRVNATGGLKLFDADDSHYAQIVAGTITSNTDVLTLGHAAIIAGTAVDLNGQELIFDADADTSITADTDDQIDIKIAGADDFQFTANTFTAQSGSSIVVPDGGLTFGSTAISSTAAELNLLDGGTSVGSSITLADGDGIVVNDGGTMKTIPASDVKTYAGGAALDDVSTGDAASTLATSAGNITIDAQGNDTDIIFKGTDGGADTTFWTMDGSDKGNLVPGSTSTGIYLGVSSATASNLLDDYEEGTWTPTFMDNAGSTGTTDTSSSVGRYTKIGNTVFISVYWKVDSITSHPGGLYAGIGGFPFTCSDATGMCGTAPHYSNVNVPDGHLTVTVENAKTRGIFYSQRDNSTYNTISPNNIADNDVVYASFSYRTA